ncbi:MAG TPA: hypothetical protein VK939_01375 [Longimicrobiales bacterium]|nr:hypothetical protein [Longimicrobiales bacterium]
MNAFRTAYLGAWLVAGCGPADASRDAAATDSASVAVAAAEDDEHGAAGWLVTLDSVGPVRYGMPLAEVRSAFGPELVVPDVPEPACDYASLEAGTVELLLMIVSGRVVRADVRAGSLTTDRGAKIGDSKRRIMALYGSAVEVRPHKYVDGEYLIVSAPGDTLRRIVFETSHDTVTSFRAGRRPEVEWVEGCS